MDFKNTTFLRITLPLICLLASFSGHSQCMIENYQVGFPTNPEINPSSEYSTHGQSFTTVCGGNLKYFEIFQSVVFDSSTAQLEVYDGIDISVPPIYMQQYDHVNAPPSDLPIRFTISDDLLLAANHTYTILITASNFSFQYCGEDTYSGGAAFIHGVLQPASDLYFTLFMADPENDCNIGNEYIMPNAQMGYSLYSLIAYKVVLTESGTITDLGITGKSNINIRMAFYDELNGVPHNMLAQTGVVPLYYGKQTYPVAPVNLAPGNYWIALISGSLSNYFMYVESSDYVYETTHFRIFNNFGSPMPQPFGGQPSTSLGKVPVFAAISCQSLSLGDFEIPIVTAYPNPTKDKVYLKGIATSSDYAIFESTGREIASGTFLPDSFIDVSHFNSGIYFIKLKNKTAVKFIKN